MNQPDRYKLINPDHLKELIAGITKARDKALVLLFIDTGLRAGEVVQLDKDFVDLGGGQNSDGSPPKSGSGMTENGNATTRRRFHLTAHTVDALIVYLSERGDDVSPVLFVGRMGRRLSTSEILHMMHGWCNRIGIERIGPRDLRRSFALRVMNSGASLLVLSKLLGHASVTTTIKLFPPSAGPGDIPV